MAPGNREEKKTGAVVLGYTWRIIPGLVSGEDHPYLQAMKRPFIRGITPFRGLTITMFINHLLTGMILQVYTPGSLTARPCKMVVQKTILSYWVWVTFQGRAVKLREGR